MSLHILRHKSWNVWNEENKARVRADEEKLRDEVDKQHRQQLDVDAELRRDALRKRRSEPAAPEPAPAAPSASLFDGIKGTDMDALSLAMGAPSESQARAPSDSRPNPQQATEERVRQNDQRGAAFALGIHSARTPWLDVGRRHAGEKETEPTTESERVQLDADRFRKEHEDPLTAVQVGLHRRARPSALFRSAAQREASGRALERTLGQLRSKRQHSHADRAASRSRSRSRDRRHRHKKRHHHSKEKKRKRDKKRKRERSRSKSASPLCDATGTVTTLEELRRARLLRERGEQRRGDAMFSRLAEDGRTPE